MITLYINENKKMGHINPEIYGHFSEHLGRCIYEGLYVGENSEIPNVNGMRTDVVEALKELKVPVLRWPISAAMTSLPPYSKSAAEPMRMTMNGRMWY